MKNYKQGGSGMRAKPPKRNIRLPEDYEHKTDRRHSAAPKALQPAGRREGARHTRGGRGQAAKRRKRRTLLRRALYGLLAACLLVCVGLGGYLAISTRNDFLWLE